MPHDVELIILLAVGFSLALVFGYIAARLRLPPLMGYLIAGVIISPNTPGIVADIHLANQLAELGVMFLMFGVGMHFSLNDLMQVRRIALPGASIADCRGDPTRCRRVDDVGLEFWFCLNFWLKSVLCQYRCSLKSIR